MSRLCVVIGIITVLRDQLRRGGVNVQLNCHTKTMHLRARVRAGILWNLAIHN